MRQPTLTETVAYMDVTGTKPPKAYIGEAKWFPSWLYGFTFFKLILVKDITNVPVICHELKHVEQFIDDPWMFHIKYAYNYIKHGYRDNPYEDEAFNVELLVKQR